MDFLKIQKMSAENGAPLKTGTDMRVKERSLHSRFSSLLWCLQNLTYKLGFLFCFSPFVTEEEDILICSYYKIKIKRTGSLQTGPYANLKHTEVVQGILAKFNSTAVCESLL